MTDSLNALRAKLAKVKGLTVVGGKSGPTVICRLCKTVLFAGRPTQIEESECVGSCPEGPSVVERERSRPAAPERNAEA